MYIRDTKPNIRYHEDNCRQANEDKTATLKRNTTNRLSPHRGAFTCAG